jgi:16S rRNA G1207 methylase RsmC
LKNLEGRGIQRAAVINPGQGHIPVMLWKLVQPERVALIDRDLLALRYSRFSLILNDCPDASIQVFHQVGLALKSDGKIDLFTGVLREENRQANLLMFQQAVEQLSPGGVILVSGGSTAITRLVDYVNSDARIRLVKRERRRGYSLLALERTG